MMVPVVSLLLQIVPALLRLHHRLPQERFRVVPNGLQLAVGRFSRSGLVLTCSRLDFVRRTLVGRCGVMWCSA